MFPYTNKPVTWNSLIPLTTCFHSLVHPEPKSRILCATNVWFCCLAYASLKDLIYFHYHKDIWMGVANAKHSLKNNHISNKFSQYIRQYHTTIKFSQVPLLMLSVSERRPNYAVRYKHKIGCHRNQVSWNAMPCCSVSGSQHFEGKCHHSSDGETEGLREKNLFHWHLVYDGSHRDRTGIRLESLMWDAGDRLPQSLNSLQICQCSPLYKHTAP